MVTRRLFYLIVILAFAARVVSVTTKASFLHERWCRRPGLGQQRARCSSLRWKTDFPHEESDILGRILSSIRGGSDSEYDEYDSENEEEESEDEEDENEEDTEIEDQDTVQIEMNVEKYEDPLVPNPMANLYISLGVMLLARRVDLFSPAVVRIARWGFIAYLVVLQLFLFYVRFQAKSINDRTPITLKNPLSSVLQSQLGGEDNGMMKSLASSFLNSKSTVLEYDLRQARSMQSGLIMNMAFMWFLHFKMNQVQPLIIQSATGLMNMVYSPLFQVYVLGRNLERPFKNPAMAKALETQLESQDEEIDIDNIETADASEIVAAEAAAEDEAGSIPVNVEVSDSESSESGEEEVEDEDETHEDEEYVSEDDK